MSSPIASRQVAFGGSAFIPVRVKVEWGEYPQHLIRFVSVTVGGYALLRKPFPEAKEEAVSVLQSLLGGIDEGLLADLRRAIEEVRL